MTASSRHPLSQLCQLIYSDPSPYTGRSTRYALHSSVDSRGTYWKVRVYTISETSDGSSKGTSAVDDADGDGDYPGVTLYKGYMKIKDIDKHFASRPSTSHTSSSSFSPSLYYLRNVISEGQLHIRSEQPVKPKKKDHGGEKSAKKRKFNDGDEQRDRTGVPPEEITGHLPQAIFDHAASHPLSLTLLLSSPTPSSISSESPSEQVNLAAQRGLMEMCAEIIEWSHDQQKTIEDLHSQNIELSQSHASHSQTASTTQRHASPGRDTGGNDSEEMKKMKKQLDELQRQLRLAQRRLPTSPSSAAKGALPASFSSLPLGRDGRLVKPVKDLGTSRLQPTVKAAKKVETGFASDSDSD